MSCQITNGGENSRAGRGDASLQLWRVSAELGSEDTLHLIKKFRHLATNDVPDDLLVDRRVSVDRDVAEAGDAAPLHFGMPVPDRGRHMPHRFARYLQVAHDSVERLLVRDKLLDRHPLRESQHLRAAVAHVLQVEPRITRHGLLRAPQTAAFLA